MLSILIPVYNFDIRDLIETLHDQSSLINFQFEILCYDDGSQERFKILNRSISSKTNVKYVELPANAGRSKIRNLLAKDAEFNNLLFLDCDSKVTSDQFISKYLESINPGAVIYGGRSYEKEPPIDRNTYFRWFYGLKREIIPVEVRKRNPYKSFMTNNFLIPKAIFNKIKFNEDLKGYGHEDTLFGQKLKEEKISIIHINNPLCHIGLEPFKEFIKKTEEGIGNLFFLINKKMITEEVKLFKYFMLVKKIGISSLILALYNRKKQFILANLASHKPNLLWFDIYKLGYLISLSRKQ